MSTTTATAPSARPAGRRSRLGRLALGGLAAVALAVGIGPSTALASADGCTYTQFPDEYVCGTVKGKKLHVDEVTVIRGKVAGGTIKNYHALVTVQAPNGSRWEFTSAVHKGKSYLRAWRTLKLDRSFPDNSRLCGSFFENGDYQDTVCFKIHD